MLQNNQKVIQKVVQNNSKVSENNSKAPHNTIGAHPLIPSLHVLST